MGSTAWMGSSWLCDIMTHVLWYWIFMIRIFNPYKEIYDMFVYLIDSFRQIWYLCQYCNVKEITFLNKFIFNLENIDGTRLIYWVVHKSYTPNNVSCYKLKILTDEGTFTIKKKQNIRFWGHIANKDVAIIISALCFRKKNSVKTPPPQKKKIRTVTCFVRMHLAKWCSDLRRFPLSCSTSCITCNCHYENFDVSLIVIYCGMYTFTLYTQ